MKRQLITLLFAAPLMWAAQKATITISSSEIAFARHANFRPSGGTPDCGHYATCVPMTVYLPAGASVVKVHIIHLGLDGVWKEVSANYDVQ